jgi:hypothetical protein
MKEDPETYKRAKELSSFFEQKVKEIEQANISQVIQKGANDPNSAVSELKSNINKY